ncbi:hypothetical protein ECG_05119 [Echinococcus granulosus]|uniref:Expressed protein n=2 Tax=Echinococcus granulosus TaxID=6210 RepID=A0A068X3X9_ECHGR|nr:hypothetical protein ECG_05119 [Echinococcus granulosus]CDS24710.1 expressed protein [Echinococcus granulosus]
MLLFRPPLPRFVWMTQTSLLSVLPRGGVASVPDDFADVTEVSEIRSPPLPKALSTLKINEGGNINRADILGTVTDLKMLDRLSQPEKQWATLFIRTCTPVLSTPLEDAECGEFEVDETDKDDSRVTYHLRTYHNRVHVFHLRLLPLVKRLRPGDRVFVTGFLSYYKPSFTSSPTDVAEVRKIGVVVAERLILLGSSEETMNSETE